MLASFAIFQGILTCIARKPYILVVFQRGGGGPENVATVRSNELLAMTWTLSGEKKGFLGLNRLNDPVEQLRQFGTYR